MRRYDKTAELYEGLYGEEQEVKYKKALETIKIDCNSVILDVGCGSGLFFKHLLGGQCVVGVDVSRKLLLKAKQRAKKSLNLFIVQADADHLPFQNRFFDLLFSFTVLQNVPNPKKTVKEIQCATKVSGEITISILKKYVSTDLLIKLMEASKLKVSNFIDDEGLNCYIIKAKIKS
jgi:ubiquinone/menaquinone biosynthesis C-methylase UbiE